MNRRLDIAISWGLVIAIAFSALAFGATEPWSIAGLQLLLILLIELWGLRMVVQRRLRVVLPAAALPLFGVIIFGLIQSIAWPGADGARSSLSMDVDLTRGMVLTLIVITGGFLLAANFWTSRDRLKSFAWFLIIFGFAFSLFALIQGFTWNQRLYWVRPISMTTFPYGSFLSKNNYAGYIELFIPMAAAIALNIAVSRPARMFAGFAAAVMSISVAFSLSRGGMVSLGATLIFFVVVAWQTARRRSRAIQRAAIEEGYSLEGRRAPWWRRALFNPGAAVVGIVAMVLIGLSWLGPESVANRLTQGSLRGTDSQAFYTSRGWIWQDTWTIFKAHPIAGVGLGAFRTAFPIYTASDGLFRTNQAHNDYLQILSDGGLLGALLAAWFIFALFRAFTTGLRAREPWRVAVVLGAGAGIFSVLIHSFFDFNLQIPSTALLFLVLSLEENRFLGSD